MSHGRRTGRADPRESRPAEACRAPACAVPVSRDPEGVLGPTKLAGLGTEVSTHELAACCVPELPLTAARCDATHRRGRLSASGLRRRHRLGSAPLAGGTMVRWRGGGGDPHDVWLAANCADVRPQAGFRVSAERLEPADLTECDGLPITTSCALVVFEMRYAAASASRWRRWTWPATRTWSRIDEVAAYIAEHPGWTGHRTSTRGAPAGPGGIVVAAGDTDGPRVAAGCRPAAVPPQRRRSSICRAIILRPRTSSTRKRGWSWSTTGSCTSSGSRGGRDRDREQVLRAAGLQC